MQNVDTQKSTKTDEDNLDLAKGPPTPLSSIPETTAAITNTSTSSTAPIQEGVHLDPQVPPKSKARSRLTSALRKLSKSKRKKENIIQQTSQESKDLKEPQAAAVEKVVTSSLEDIPEPGGPESSATTSSGIEEKSRKKSKLTRSFILGSLKKAKISPQDSQETKDNIPEDTNIASFQISEDLQHKSNESTEIINSKVQESPQRATTVQITISGRKIEQTKKSPPQETTGREEHVTLTTIATAATDTEYLTPSEDTPIDAATTSKDKKEVIADPITNIDQPKAKETKKKKLKLKKIATSIAQTKKSASKLQAAVQKQTTTEKKQNEEKIVITQSARDTPPPERAPAKPSRLAVTTNSATDCSVSQTLVVSKPTTRAAATVTSPSLTQQQRQLVDSKNVQLITTTTSTTTTTITTTITTNPTTTVNATVIGTATNETVTINLMQTPAAVASTQGTLQRGHRFPKPSTSASITTTVLPTPGNIIPATTLIPLKTSTVVSTGTVASVDSTVTVTDANKTTSPSTSNVAQQRKIQFQQLSHASQSHSLPKDTDDIIEVKSVSKVQQQSQSNLSNNLLLQSPGYSPPPIPNSTPFTTPETRSPAHRRQHSETATLQVITVAIDDSVDSLLSSGPDADAISSAESANLSAFIDIENSSYNNTPTSSPQPTTAYNTLNDQSSSPFLRFAIGSSVRTLPERVLGSSFDTFKLHNQNSFGSDRSTDSQSPKSESSRKRIRYIDQPTLFDELESLQLRREVLKYQEGAVSEEFSLESENDDSTGDEQDPMPAFGDLTMDQEMEPTIMTTSSSEKREHLYKILVIGELGTGKTSFIKRYVHQFFSQNYRATIGVDFALKVLHWDKDTIVRLQLWDIAGQERFGNMTRVYYKEAVGAFIVFDVTRSGTFDCVSKWKEDLDSKVQLPDGRPIPCILLANKCDQEKQGLVTTPEKMDEYVKENGFAGWFETSAKENINIDEAAKALVSKILLNDKLISDADIADSEKFNLNATADQTHSESSKKCAC